MANTKVVFLIEDEKALQEAVKLKLEKAGIKVYAFTSAEEALISLDEKKPDLFWLDILLPGMSGLEFLAKMRENKDLHDLPVIVVSVSTGNEKRALASKLNVLDFIVKSEESLNDIIKKVKNILDKLDKEK